MRRPIRLPLPLVAATVLAATACSALTRGGGGASSEVDTMRRVPVELQLASTSIASTDDSLPMVLRLTNPRDRSVRLDFTGDPLFNRGPRDKVQVPALWYTVERVDVISGSGSMQARFTARDTVLAPRATMEVPLVYSIRALGLVPGLYRIRAGLGSHASDWEQFTVK